MRGPPQKPPLAQTCGGRGLWSQGWWERLSARVSCQRTEDILTGRTRSFHCNGTKALTSVRFTVPLQPKASAAVSPPRGHQNTTARLLPASVKGHKAERPAAGGTRPKCLSTSQTSVGFALGINQAKAMLMINQRESRFLVLWWWDASEAK